MITNGLLCQLSYQEPALTWTLQVALRLGAAALLGAVIGAEREHHGRSAGLRTHLLVALGSALVMAVSLHFADVFSQASPGGTITIDPARVAYGVMGGIGFLGAGAIIRYGIAVRGLTTAASLWCSAAVGLACGFGMLGVATITAIIVLFTLTVLARVEQFIPSRQTKTVTVMLPLTERDNLSHIRDLLEERGAHVVDLECARDIKNQLETLTYHVSMPSKISPDKLLSFADKIPEISHLTVQ